MPNRPAGEADLVPDDTPVESRYERDLYAWALHQAALIRAGRWNAVDRANVAEEIESLGREQYAKLESALRVLLTHMLKWDMQPERRSRSWTLSIKAQRIRVERIIEQNPGLKSRLSEATVQAYRLARIEAALETGLEEEKFGTELPYSWNDIIARDFSV